MFCFFFSSRRRHTRCGRDWSSDVCSSDLIALTIDAGSRVGEIYGRLRDLRDHYAQLIRERYPQIPRRISGYNLDRLLPDEIGRASCRERVWRWVGEGGLQERYVVIEEGRG